MARRTAADPDSKGKIEQAPVPALLPMSEEEYREGFAVVDGVRASDRERAVFAVFTTNSYSEAAKRCGLTLPRLKKYLDEPSFQEDMRQLRSQLLSRAFEGMLALFTEATKTLTGILRGGTPNQQIDAARLALEHCHLSNIALRDQAESEALLQAGDTELMEEVEDGE